MAGYGVAIDLTLRDVQSELKKKGLPWEIAKGFDTACPLAIRVAPTWDLKNNQMWYSVVNELKRRGTWQGCRVEGECCKAGNY